MPDDKNQKRYWFLHTYIKLVALYPGCVSEDRAVMAL